MDKISMNDFKQAMSYDIVTDSACIEMAFCIEGSREYDLCWLGKNLDKETKKPIYWFGLTADGTQAYDFDSFTDFMNAKIFKGQSLREIWDLVDVYSLDGFNVKERLPFYLGAADGPIRKASS